MKLGNLKALRESLGMTQKEFAATLGIGVTTYNGYETGARDPKSEFWVAVAQKYGVTIDYLMGFSNDPHSVFDAKKEPPAGPEGQTGGMKQLLTTEQVEQMLIQCGYIKKGEDLSDDDLRFLMSVGEALDTWFSREK